MKFTEIDIEKWERKTHFQLYSNNAKSTFNISVNIDVTKAWQFAKKQGLKFYPICIYLVSKAVNEMKEFRMNFNEAGKLGYWDTVLPAYPIFHDDDKTFSYIYTQYHNKFCIFYENIINDIKEHKDMRGVITKAAPLNSFTVSCIPWVSFTGFALNIYSDYYLVPVITWGKYYESNNKILMPLTVQAHHAVIDGYHAAAFINKLQTFMYEVDVVCQ